MVSVVNVEVKVLRCRDTELIREIQKAGVTGRGMSDRKSHLSDDKFFAGMDQV